MPLIIPIVSGCNPSGRVYDISVDLGNPDEPLIMAEGLGMDSASGAITLADILHPSWDRHVQLGRCGWLRDMAVEEEQKGRRFTPAEILKRAQQMKGPA
ncbi:MAG: hypothetical protein ACO1QS_07685 [Verrucomicrobiota bacterium]